MGDGFSSSSSLGSFKSANSIGGKLPAGGSTIRGTGGLTQRAEDFSMRHSTKGLSSAKPFTTKVRPIKNEMKSIGRKRGY
jgi:hypothetical protein